MRNRRNPPGTYGSIFVTRIRLDIANLNEMAEQHGYMPTLVKLAIENAEEWLTAGGLSRYSGEDFDVYYRLLQVKGEFAIQRTYP